MASMGHYAFMKQFIDEFEPSAFEAEDHTGATPSMIAEKCRNIKGLALLESRRRRLGHITGRELRISGPAPDEQPNFYTLEAGEPWLSWHEDSEDWEHLTYHSFEVQERPQSNIRNIAEAKLTTDIVTVFASQFFNSWPDESVVRRAWKRLLRSPLDNVDRSTHPKSFVLAILYMLHLEQSLKLRASSDDAKTQVKISGKRLDILTRFDLWIGCRCSLGCSKEWNFVNKIGMYRPLGEQTPPCEAVRALRERLVPREVHKGKSYKFFNRKDDDRKILEDMYKEWKIRE
ncbi:MAG: hypothetical protein Q9166_001027 [cf. Caloplaca sp. 2 TL-2023]